MNWISVDRIKLSPLQNLRRTTSSKWWSVAVNLSNEYNKDEQMKHRRLES